MKLDPMFLSLLLGSAIPFLSHALIHRYAKSWWHTIVETVLSLAAAEGVAVQQGGGLVTKTVLVSALVAWIASQASWTGGIAQFDGLNNFLDGLLGKFALGAPNSKRVAPLTGPAPDDLLPGVWSGPPPKFTPSVTPTVSPSAHLGDAYVALGALTDVELAQVIQNEIADRGITNIDHNSANVGTGVSTQSGTIVHDANGESLFGAPIPADIPVPVDPAPAPTPVPDPAPTPDDAAAMGVPFDPNAASPVPGA